MSRIEDIRARLDAATPGPWKWDSGTLDGGEHGYEEVIEADVECMPYCYGGSARVKVSDPNKNLIAHAPADLRDLLAVVDVAREARLAYLEDAADWKRIARAQLDLRNALARLDAS